MLRKISALFSSSIFPFSTASQQSPYAQPSRGGIKINPMRGQKFRMRLWRVVSQVKEFAAQYQNKKIFYRGRNTNLDFFFFKTLNFSTRA